MNLRVTSLASRITDSNVLPLGALISSYGQSVARGMFNSRSKPYTAPIGSPVSSCGTLVAVSWFLNMGTRLCDAAASRRSYLRFKLRSTRAQEAKLSSLSYSSQRDSSIGTFV